MSLVWKVEDFAGRIDQMFGRFFDSHVHLKWLCPLKPVERSVRGRESRAKDDQDARFEVSGGQTGLV